MTFFDDRDYSVYEVIQKINNEYGISKEWPKAVGVTAATFGRICQWIFTKKIIESDNNNYCQSSDWLLIPISLGKIDYGIMLKNIEFIISNEPSIPR